MRKPKRCAGLLCAALALTACSSARHEASRTPPRRWRPSVNDTWQWQLRGPLDMSYDVRVYDIDLLETPAGTIEA